MSTGERIKQLREEKEMSQETLAGILGVQRQIISYYETGARRPNVNDLIKLAYEFNTTVDYLLGLSNVRTAEIEIKAICEYTGLSEKAIESLHEETPTEHNDNDSDYLMVRNEFITSGSLGFFCATIATKKTEVERFRKNKNETEDKDTFYSEYAKLFQKLELAEYEAIKMCFAFIERFSKENADYSDIAKRNFELMSKTGETNG